MNKLFKLLMVILLMFSLVSCNSDPKPNDTNNNNTTDTDDNSGVGTNEEIFD